MAKIKTFVLLFFLIFGVNSQAQSYKFLTTGLSVMEKNDKGEWGKWSDLQPVSIVITLDTSKNRIVVYSQEVQLYDILTYQERQENENDLVYPFTCKDDDGREFDISIITRKNQNNRKQLYINQKDVIVVYNIVNFPEGDHKK
jgi:hypothetical protein